MDFRMDIDNSRKRFRTELDLDADCEGQTHSAKKVRQSESYSNSFVASARDPAPSPACSSLSNESIPSTPASSIQDENDPLLHARASEWRPREPAPEPELQPRPQCTIISGFNQALRNEKLVQSYPSLPRVHGLYYSSS